MRHEKILVLVNNINWAIQNIQLIRNLYRNQQTTVRVNDEITSWMKIKRWVRQGCVLSPLLFSLYSEWIFRECDTDKSRITVGGRCFNNCRYANNTVLFATCEDNLRKLIKEVNDKSLDYGLRINATKTKTIVVSKSNTTKDFE